MKPRDAFGSDLVYSTDGGRICPECRESVSRCACRAAAPPRAAGARAGAKLRIGRETRGRGGKTVTLVAGLPLGPVELGALAKSLKAACGSGGTAKEGTVEIQGDHVERVSAWLRADGWAVAGRAGS